MYIYDTPQSQNTQLFEYNSTNIYLSTNVLVEQDI